MTAAYANASNIFISDTVTADETNENKTIAVWLDAIALQVAMSQ